jgi:hypothetical protein
LDPGQEQADAHARRPADHHGASSGSPMGIVPIEHAANGREDVEDVVEAVLGEKDVQVHVVGATRRGPHAVRQRTADRVGNPRRLQRHGQQ